MHYQHLQFLLRFNYVFLRKKWASKSLCKRVVWRQNTFLIPRRCLCRRKEYSMRNAADISVLSRRTEIYSRSFFPSSIDYWNTLPLSVRSADSLSAFKQLFTRFMFRSPEVPNYFVSGQRRSSVYHCRIRNNCSYQNKDLFNNHLKATAACECGFESEDAEHYIFFCNRFTEQRTSLFQPVNFSLLIYAFSCTVLLISSMTTMLNFFYTSNILQKKRIVFDKRKSNLYIVNMYVACYTY